MKTYLFNADNGLYEGEAFEEDGMLQFEEGITVIPPPDYEPGLVPVFDCRKSAWALIPLSIARQLLNVSPSITTENQS